MPDYIPDSDAEFDNWLNNFMTALASRQQALGIPPELFTGLQALRVNWISAFQAQQQTHAAAASATQDKQQARDALDSALRAVVRLAQASPNMTPGEAAALGITVPSTTRTPAPTPTTRPVVQVDTGQRLRHTITFTDETTPNRRAKPAGVRGCEIWVKVGDPAPAGPTQLSFLALDTSSPYLVEYGEADAGKVAHYMLRWVNSRDEKGPWSQTTSATIPA